MLVWGHLREKSGRDSETMNQTGTKKKPEQDSLLHGKK